jgi:xanthine dehydrogenase accessory factor
VYEVAVSIAACLRSGTRAQVAWIIDGTDLPSRNPGDALAVTAGGGKTGGLLGGALDDQVAALMADGVTGRIATVSIDEIGALLTGLPVGATARCVIAAAEDYPAQLWAELEAGHSFCLVIELDDERITGMELYRRDRVAEAGEAAARLLARGSTTVEASDDRIVSVWWPVPRLVLVGGGAIADAIEVAAGPLGWRVLRFPDATQAVPLIIGLGPTDLVVVTSHDLDSAGEALQAAVSGRAGYVAALGTPEVAHVRRQWLLTRQVDGIERIHSPAGLDIGARRPPEVAIAVLAQALAVLTGRSSATT